MILADVKFNEERSEYFLSLLRRFDESTGVDYSGIEELAMVRWMRQSHIFRTPFYYIEYGIAQLGAIAIYRNYRETGSRAIKQYENFLKLGYSRGLKEAYKIAGIKFEFSEEFIRGLVEFVKREIELLNK
ncbi:MAG: M3 family metallopeptidase [Promethearchaeota archaeon]